MVSIHTVLIVNLRPTLSGIFIAIFTSITKLAKVILKNRLFSYDTIWK